MTDDEIKALRCNMAAHMNMGYQHVSTYVCVNAPAGHKIAIKKVVEYDERTHEPLGCKSLYCLDNETFEKYDDFKQKLLAL